MAKPCNSETLPITRRPTPRDYGTVWDRLKLRLLRLSLSLGGGLWLRRIFHALSYLGVFQKSYDERFSFPNALWFEWGFESQEMQHDGWMNALHPDDRDFIMAELERQLKVGDYVELPGYRIVTKSGETKWVLSKGVVVERNSAGVVTHYLGADFDVTRQKATEAKVDRLLSERTTILKESRHRIKNQIKAVDVHIGRMMEQASVSPEDLGSIRLQLRSIQTINQLLTQFSPSRNFDARYLIANIVQDVRGLFDPDESVDVSMSMETVRAPASTAMILAVGVQEALTNAFKHTSYGRSSERIRIELMDERGVVQLRVVNHVQVPSNKSVATSADESIGEGLISLKEMVENEQGNMEAGFLESPDEWATVIRVPATKA